MERFVLEEEVMPAVLPPGILAEFRMRKPNTIREAVHLLASPAV
jgi:hypothetical protein